MDKDIKEILKMFNRQFKSRSKNRIEPFLKEFQLLWELHPDMRFMQIIQLITEGQDMFYKEEDEILQIILKLKENKINILTNPEGIQCKNCCKLKDNKCTRIGNKNGEIGVCWMEFDEGEY